MNQINLEPENKNWLRIILIFPLYIGYVLCYDFLPINNPWRRQKYNIYQFSNIDHPLWLPGLQWLILFAIVKFAIYLYHLNN